MSSPGQTTTLHYLGYDETRGGIAAVIRALSIADRFRCVLGMNRGYSSSSADPLTVETFSPMAGERLSIGAFWRARRVAKEARVWLGADRNRVFHGHSRAGLAVALWMVAFGERRVVASVHCYGRQRWFYRRAARKMGDRLFWLSPAMKRYYRLAEESWTQCIPGCVADVPHAKAAVPRSDRALRLGGIGALVSWKRWHLLLDALALVPPVTREKLSFVHIGADDGSAESRRYADALRQQTVSLGVTDLVEWRGHQASTRPLLGEVDCLVLPSHHEPFSVAQLEALFAGIPVIASNSGGGRDLLSGGRNGWLFRSGDARDLARTLAMLVESDALRRIEIDTPGLMRFTAAAVAEQWQEVYARVVQ
jgi:glycosyltransferase involved in cell wall biosynthesis